MNQIEQENYKNREGLTLGDRMKKLEDITRNYLIPKQPVIVRIDGKAFHTYTKQKCFVKPFDANIMLAFEQSTKELCESVQNVEFAYHQSDEVSIFLKDYNEEKQQQFFNGNIQKISSVIASEFTYYFNRNIKNILAKDLDMNFEGEEDCEEFNTLSEYLQNLKPAFFDCRTFNVPLHEVSNYFIWRQRDAIKNSISSYASYFFSNKSLLNKNSGEKIDMIKSLDDPRIPQLGWDGLPIAIQRGTAYYEVLVEEVIKDLPESTIQYYIKQGKELPDIVTRNKWIMDYNIPIFSENKTFIEKYVING